MRADTGMFGVCSLRYYLEPFDNEMKLCSNTRTQGHEYTPDIIMMQDVASASYLLSNVPALAVGNLVPVLLCHQHNCRLVLLLEGNSLHGSKPQ